MAAKLELWGGHECTVNRIGDMFFDQTRRSGHQGRETDLDLFADLGLKALRYPVLWERVAPERPDQRDWRWSDQRLNRLDALGVRPIIGLLHHGSGPRYTQLLDGGFSAGLADHARAVAERYPGVRDWTPVNEPLTTARFSALYGCWYPHLKDERLFWRALLNQIDATRLAMREIRRINSEARLIQTEDLGRTYATPAVAYQADFDNERRWATWDLLMGAVTPGHRLWDHLAGFGYAERLSRIADDPCPPDVLGINHYVTSDRFLDHRWTEYPPHNRGGNGATPYADVEAIRVLTPAPGGLELALMEAWSRYGKTMAVTESHLGCTREEQIRWVVDTWRTVEGLKGRGVDIEAVTAWALLGSYDWNSLLTRDEGVYECGAFDVRSGSPRPTALAHTLRTLAGGQGGVHPAAAGAGWWRRDIRLAYRPVVHHPQDDPPRPTPKPAPQRLAPLLITGATGMLGRAFAKACDHRGIAYVLTERTSLSLDDAKSIKAALLRHQPWAVINAAGWARVDDAEGDVGGCLSANTAGAVRLAEACNARTIPFVGFSSDLVFDGRRSSAPYCEADAINPLNVYGRSQAEAERRILAMGGAALLVRTAGLFSPSDPHTFAFNVVKRLAFGGSIDAAGDLTVSPTYVPDLVDAVLDLLIDGATGIWHLTHETPVSWAAFAIMIAQSLSADVARIKVKTWRSLGWRAERPAFSALASSMGRRLPPLSDAVARFVASSPIVDLSSDAGANAPHVSDQGDGRFDASSSGAERPRRQRSAVPAEVS